jgi:hypothetical protein
MQNHHVDRLLEAVMPMIDGLIVFAARRRRLDPALVRQIATLKLLKLIAEGAPPFNDLTSALEQVDPASGSEHSSLLRNVVWRAAYDARKDIETHTRAREQAARRQHRDGQRDLMAMLRRPVRLSEDERRLVEILPALTDLPVGFGEFAGALVVRAAARASDEPFELLEHLRDYLSRAQHRAIAAYIRSGPSRESVRQNICRGKKALRAAGVLVALGLAAVVGGSRPLAPDGARAASHSPSPARVAGVESGASPMLAGVESGAAPMLAGVESGAAPMVAGVESGADTAVA